MVYRVEGLLGHGIASASTRIDSMTYEELSRDLGLVRKILIC
jgi:hypothetical protein